MKSRKKNNFIVYKITNKINNKLYFGITRYSIGIRWSQHKLKNKTSHLSLAIRKYGQINFTIKVVKKCNSEQEMYDLEIYLISKYKSNDRNYGYNNSSGGEKSSAGKVVSLETRRKLSEIQKGKKRKPHTEKTKEKIRKIALKNKAHLSLVNSLGNRKGKPAHNKRKIILNGQEVFDSIKEASNKTGILISSIANNLTGISKKTKIGVWKYVAKV